MEETKTRLIRFDTGVRTYSLNGDCEIRLNPTDSAVLGKIYDTFYSLDQKQEEYDREIRNAEPREVFDLARRWDGEMRDMIDGALGEGVSDAVFGEMNCYAMADGLPVWANLLLAIIDEVDGAAAAEKLRTNPRLEKYTAKYHRNDQASGIVQYDPGRSRNGNRNRKHRR